MEVGQITGGAAMSEATSKDAVALQNWITNAAGTRAQITLTGYDMVYGYDENYYPNGILPQDILVQKNLRNRVSYSVVIDAATNFLPSAGTFYTYDIHGNVDTLVQYFGNSAVTVNAMNSTGNGYKKIVYDFDLVSGKVNQVSYQRGKDDAFYHRYSYDAENRLTDVFTGRDSVQLFLFPERESHYTYYKHGPLARTDIGQLKVQGQDYIYTLQGWIKAVNPVMGGTLTNGTDTTEVYPTAQDAYGYSLNYFRGDYKAIGYSPQSTTIIGALGANAAPLYNGNISAMGVYVPKLGAPKLYNYHYDQLNRIVAMDVFNGLSPSTGTFTPISISDYRERVSYDPNGNIMTYTRHGDAARLSMDSMRYFYTAGTNRLHKVVDDATDIGQPQYANYNDLKQGQVDNNYAYDEIGNLTKDLSEGIQAGGISWTVYGKIASVTKNGSTIYYTYDASGNRISKRTATDETYYVRDASGNVLSVYTKPAAGSLQQSEIHLYGSSRIGMLTTKTTTDFLIQLSGGFGQNKSIKFTRGEKLFELSNHLGNVLVTVTDRRQQFSAGGVNVDYYVTDVASANDYYPFGMSMPGRKYEAQSGYRYGFNGKEKETNIAFNNYDFDARIYNGRIGKWLNIDPLQKKYPGESNYIYVSNSPLIFLDADGKDRFVSITIIDVKGKSTTTLFVIKDEFINYECIKKSGFGNDIYVKYDIVENVTIDYSKQKQSINYSIKPGERHEISSFDFDRHRVESFLKWDDNRSVQKSGVSLVSEFSTSGADQARADATEGPSEIWYVDGFIAAFTALGKSTEASNDLKELLLELQGKSNEITEKYLEEKEKIEAAEAEKNKKEIAKAPATVSVSTTSSNKTNPKPVKLYYNKKSAEKEKGPGQSSVHTYDKTKPDTIYYQNRN